LERLAEDLGVKLEIIVTNDMDNIAYMLNSGKGDLVAASVTMTRDRVEELQFTEHLALTRQVLVQRRPGYNPTPPGKSETASEEQNAASDETASTRDTVANRSTGDQSTDQNANSGDASASNAQDEANEGGQIESPLGELLAEDLEADPDTTEDVDAESEDEQVNEKQLVADVGSHGRILFIGQGEESQFIRDPIELIGKTVHVRRGSVYYQRLKNLEQEIGGEINIVTVPGDVVTEELIRKVHTGEIDYTIADEQTALINRAYYTQLDVSVPISFSQRIGWVVRKNSPELLKEVNRWLRETKNSGTLAVIHNRYYRDPRGFVQRVESEYYSETGSKLSIYDDQIKAAAKKIDWDWRLLASLIYQESRFNPNARSWAGATGLMQLMPATGLEMGVTQLHDPTQNISAGIKYLALLKERFQHIENEEERLKFILASYNAGPGHVEDAQLLAEAFDHDPNIWEDNVEKFILKLSNPDYYNNYGVRYGYCRGEEPYNYVREILARADHYRTLIDDADADAETVEQAETDAGAPGAN
ncbi:MAG: transporter substrate-binding domain-containing protein, partial [Leptospiraceae bacterium]|nr:transporter substrate-binding domain-containing protein [Leptospiraceae bacterium]